MKTKCSFLALVLALVLCLSFGGSAMAEDKYTIKVMTIWSDTVEGDYGWIIDNMLKDFCAAHEGYDYEYEYAEQWDVASKLSVLIASNDVPDLFVYEPGAAMNNLIDNGIVVNLSQEMSQLGFELEDVYSEGALSALRSVGSHEDIYYVCNGLSCEAVWYNKTLFEENGLEVPESWADLEALCDVLLEKGIVPIALPNADQWPVTRWIMMYGARLGGADAHLRASTADGITFEDEIFVQAAAKIQEMAQKGYFGQGFNALTQDDAYAMFLTGKAAMLYQGSWAFSTFRNAVEGELTIDEIGYFNPGYVEGSEITPEEVAATSGVSPNMAICIGKARFDEGKNHEFLRYFFENYGNKLIENGHTSPFNPDFLTVKKENADILDSYYDQILTETKYSTLWNEAKMTTEISTICMENAQLLAEGTMTPEQYCAELAAAVAAR